MTTSSDAADYPTVIVAGIYPRSSSLSNDSQFFLSSQNQMKNLSRLCYKQYKKNLQQIFKETVTSKEALTKHTITIDKKDYYLTLLPISEDDTGLFLCEKSDEFFENYKLNKDEPALSSLPFLDGTLTNFLSRAEIYGPEFSKSKNNTDNKLKVSAPVV